MKNNNSLILSTKKVDLDINHVVSELDKLDYEEYSIIIDYLSELRKERQTKKEIKKDTQVNKPSVCPHCGNSEFTLAGKQKGMQRFKCTKCGKKIYNESKPIPVWYNSKYKPHVWKVFVISNRINIF